MIISMPYGNSTSLTMLSFDIPQLYCVCYPHMYFFPAFIALYMQLLYRQLTSEQYIMVCTKLVTKFPKLRDRIGSNGFVSFNTYLYKGCVIIIIIDNVRVLGSEGCEPHLRTSGETTQRIHLVPAL